MEEWLFKYSNPLTVNLTPSKKAIIISFTAFFLKRTPLISPSSWQASTIS